MSWPIPFWIGFWLNHLLVHNFSKNPKEQERGYPQQASNPGLGIRGVTPKPKTLEGLFAPREPPERQQGQRL